MDESYRALQVGPIGPGSVTTTPADIVWKVCNLVISVFFAFAAAVQHNDPDPYIWMTVYGVPAILGFLTAALPLHLIVRFGFLLCLVLGLHLVACMCGGLVVAVMSLRQIGQSSNPLAVEEGRELCGLIIVSMWIFLTIVFIQRKRNMLFIYLSNRSLALFACFAIIMALVPPLLWSLCFIDSLAPNISYCAEMARSCDKPDIRITENATVVTS